MTVGLAGADAGYFNDGVATVKIAGSAGAIEATSGDIKIVTSGDYYHKGNKGGTTDGHSGGILLDGVTLTQKSVEDLSPTDKVWVVT